MENYINKSDNFSLNNSHPNKRSLAPDLSELCQKLQEISADSQDGDQRGQWPQRQLAICAESDVFRWFVPQQHGGYGFSPAQIVGGYVRIASASLTTAFVISQRTAASKRIAVSENQELKSKLLPQLAEGSIFTTVGISHLTTSHRHSGQPVLSAQRQGEHWILDGFCPWVTGGAFADYLVVGAAVENQQILLAVPGDLPGIQAEKSFDLIALSDSHTGRLNFDNVKVPDKFVLRGPAEAVLQTSSTGPSTGGLETSALAIGLSTAAVDYVNQQSQQRGNLTPNASALSAELEDLQSQLMAIANGDQPNLSKEKLRAAANSFVLRATQSALLAAKGAGFVSNHPVGRWCREALFFLVWSCPQIVSDANLCELAGLDISK